MVLGTLGSTLNDELNRLANGGTYRDSGAMVDEALAAKQWANRENITPYSTDTVGVLNEIAGLGLDKKNWLDFNGICNYIAGTSGLPAAAALRQIYPTTDLLTGVAGYYIDATDASASGQTITNLGNAGALLPTTVGSSTSADSNDPKFLDHTGTNYVYLPGVALNFLSVPDAAALDIVGDIDLRWYGALDDWTPASNGRFIAKYNGVDGNYSFTFGINTGGLLTFGISPNGTVASISTSTSSVAPTVADGALLWTRATYRTSDRRVQFFTSPDGTTWTQLGTDQTNTATSIFASVSNVEIGTSNVGTANFLTGKIYRAQILNGIGGTTVLDVDTSVITTGAATSFTAVTGQTVTINRSTSGRKTVAVTQPTWLFGTDDFMEVNNRYMAHSTSDENYVYLSGNTGNSMTVADTPPLDITGDIDIQVKVALDDWTTPTQNTFVSKESPGDRAYALYSTGGSLFFSWSADGNTIIVNQSTVTYTPAAGTVSWVRATLDVNNGAGGNTGTFYTSSDGITWTQLGATSVRAGTTNIYSGANQVAIGSRANSASPAKGKFYRAIIKNGIDGTTVLDANAATILLPSQTTFTDSSSNAYTVTINKSGVGTFVSTGNYLYLPGVASNYASAPDSAALSITGDIDIRCKVALDDWTPAALTALVSKSQTTTQRSYYMAIETNGRLSLYWSANGSTQLTSTSTAAPTVSDGATLWVRVTLDVDNGASGNTATFFTSNDGITWTTLGSPVVTAGTTSIFDATSQLEIGAASGGTAQPARGKFFRAQVLNGIGGTVAFDANFEGSITSLNQASFTESSSNAATVTINRSGSAYRSAGVIDAGYLYPGATNTFANSTTDFLNFGANQDFTLVTISRIWGTNSNWSVIIGKQNADTNEPGYSQTILINGSTVATTANDGTAKSTAFAQAYTSGGLNTYTSYRSGSTLAITRNAATPTTATGSTNSISNFRNMRIASVGDLGSTLYANMEFIAAAIFRTVLTPAQIRQVTNYFANREAYL